MVAPLEIRSLISHLRQNRKRPHTRTMGGEAKMDAIDTKTVDHVGTITSDIQSSILELVNQPPVYMDQVAQLQKEKGQQAAATPQEMHRLLVNQGSVALTGASTG